MKPINDSLNQLVNKKDFKARLEALRNSILSNPEVKTFLQEHRRELDEQMVDRGLMKMHEFIDQSKCCDKCPSLQSCVNMVKGYHPQLVVKGRNIDLQYERCPRKVQEDERKEQESFIQCMYVPKEILQATMSDIEIEQGRFEAIKLVRDFVREYEPNKKMKALYLHGSFGVGKTYFLGAIANALAEKKVKSTILYVPEFLRELKGSFQDQSFNEKIEYVKKVPVLMLDDLGAESVTSWMRDDVLGTILQFRMLENLPTFFSSNLNFKELQHHLTYTQRGEQEELKAARVMERIKSLAIPVEMNGENKRNR
ncbi:MULTISPECIES: primosomal protein DnaI [Priestia]|jgi:primosomal protein DnaI|uniref:Primosomal protein DnaI n=2 Tax=Priestia TaxID=2800373 RepID=A0AAX6NC22_PRIAR|nr:MULTISPECIES: primosomal protein DnaI [Priestia]MBU8850490.1 primosomal protein DnaI [Bacillus sp. FJAT-26377]AEN87380.1 Primosome component (Helicase loader) [Priestia megaterium WSH-002]AWD64542.1 primosomal protein DnaI [Priestia megaterium]MBY0060870.1 primosomal protein DnaI [Priestia aryabhattai]MBY0213004.1 primosomal protein DnaI [Priestia aryabhattai]